MGIHGGHDETSLMLHLRPDLVDMTRARRSIPDHLVGNRHVRFGGRVQFGWLSSDFGESGVIGDPEGATAAHGARCFESAAQSFCEALHEIDRYEIRGG
jgi:creatinine amidohydrolase